MTIDDKPATGPAHWTLGYFAAEGYEISVFCDRMHGASIDLDRAIARLGADLKFPEGRQILLETWRCPTCRRPGHTTILSPPNGYQTREQP